jgi:GMP synthase-like glutamine amidotransferase
MMTEKVQQVLRQIESLSADEKQSLVDYLTEQAQRDLSVSSSPNSSQPAAPEEPDPYRRREYEWLKQHRDEYAGQYVALYGDQLVAHGADGRTVLRQAREAGFPRALMVRIEAPDELPFGGW